MRASFLGKISFTQALRLEHEAHKTVRDGGEGVTLGFETGPVITLGVRGTERDLLWPSELLSRRGFEIYRLERGGQATLHNPGQLVIFPICDIREIGARAWVDLLLSIGAQTLREFGKEAHRRKGQPGLYSRDGKVLAIGIRVLQGISTHGVAINVGNDLADFQSIRPCGVADAPVDRVGPEFALATVFSAWLRNFRSALPLGLTSSPNLTNLECSSSDVRL